MHLEKHTLGSDRSILYNYRFVKYQTIGPTASLRPSALRLRLEEVNLLKLIHEVIYAEGPVSVIAGGIFGHYLFRGNQPNILIIFCKRF